MLESVQFHKRDRATYSSLRMLVSGPISLSLSAQAGNLESGSVSYRNWAFELTIIVCYDVVLARRWDCKVVTREPPVDCAESWKFLSPRSLSIGHFSVVQEPLQARHPNIIRSSYPLLFASCYGVSLSSHVLCAAVEPVGLGNGMKSR